VDVNALGGTISAPHGGPSPLVSADDGRQDDSGCRAAADGKRASATVVEVKGSHPIYVSQPASGRHDPAHSTR